MHGFISGLFFKFFLTFNFFYILFIFERQHKLGEGQRETQNPKQALGSEPLAQSLMRGSNSQTMRSGSEPKSDA